MRRSIIGLLLLSPSLMAAQPPQGLVERISELGGKVSLSPAGEVVGVDLTSTWITDADVRLLARLPNLKKIDLSHTKITDAALENLKPLRGVEELVCYYAEYITEDGIAHLRGWRGLQRLNLRGTKVTNKVFDHLAEMTNLRSLDIGFTYIDDEGLDSLQSLTKLERLAIGGNRMTGSGLPSLKLLPSLRHLDVSGIQRADSGLWGLALTDATLRHLGALIHLKSLNLSGANLADRGLDRPGQPQAIRSELRDLSKLETLVGLEKLDLSLTPVTAGALSVLKSMPNLRELRLGMNEKVDDSIVPLLLELKNLEVLVLTGTYVSDAALTRLRSAPKLKQLHIGGTKITAQAVERFRKDCEGCVVSWWPIGPRT